MKFHFTQIEKEVLLTTSPKWISRNVGSHTICKAGLPLIGRYTGRLVKYLQDTTKFACIQFKCTLEIQRGHDFTKVVK